MFAICASDLYWYFRACLHDRWSDHVRDCMTGRLPHLGGLPHLPGAPHLHVNSTLLYQSSELPVTVAHLIVGNPSCGQT